MIRIDMSTPASERGIAARIFPIAPKPVQVEEDLDQQKLEEEAQAKVVRTPRHKGPRPSGAQVHAK
jgi:hypothetical protein